jgi:hypothetical protein
LGLGAQVVATEQCLGDSVCQLLEEVIDFKADIVVGSLTELTELEDIVDFKADIVTASLVKD